PETERCRSCRHGLLFPIEIPIEKESIGETIAIASIKPRKAPGCCKKPLKGPIHRSLALLNQILVGAGKMAAPEKAAVRRQRRRVRRGQHAVALTVDQASFLLRVAAPQHEHHALALTVDVVDGLIGELFPTLLL